MTSSEPGVFAMRERAIRSRPRLSFNLRSDSNATLLGTTRPSSDEARGNVVVRAWRYGLPFAAGAGRPWVYRLLDQVFADELERSHADTQQEADTDSIGDDRFHQFDFAILSSS